MAEALIPVLQQTGVVRECKGALAKQPAGQAVDYPLASESLRVSGPFISKRRRFCPRRAPRLGAGYSCSKGRLTPSGAGDRGLARGPHPPGWKPAARRAGRSLQGYQSPQSYWSLLYAAGSSRKRGQPRAP